MFNNRHTRLSYIVIFMTILSVFISPRIYFELYTFRLEDIIFPIMLFSLLLLMMNKVSMPKDVVYLWLTYLFYSVVVSIYTYYVYSDIRVLFYLGKEAQFFIVFLFLYIWLLSGDNSSIKVLYVERVVKLLIYANLIYGWFQILSRNYFGYYGIASLGEQASAASGATYFACLVFATYFLLKQYSLVHLILFTASFTCVFASISRSFIGASLIFLFTVVLFELYPLLKRKTSIKNAIYFVIFLLLLFITYGVYYETYTQIAYRVLNRLEVDKVINDFLLVRFNNWKIHYQLISDGYTFVFGAGKSYPEIVANSNQLYIDNQYLRNLIEIGLIGLLLWLAKLWVLYRNFSKYSRIIFPKRVFYGLITGYLYAGVFLEVFQTARSGFFFWFIAGFLLASCYIMEYKGECQKGCEDLNGSKNKGVYNHNST